MPYQIDLCIYPAEWYLHKDMKVVLPLILYTHVDAAPV